MAIELDDYDSSYDSAKYLDWVLETGIWDGCEVSWIEASEFHEEVQARILALLFENSTHPIFEQLAAQLAWIGSAEANRTLLARDIQELDFSKSDLILQAGLKKSLSKFWKKHKKEILIGVAVLAVITVVAVVAASVVGAAVGGAATAGGAALDQLDKKKPTDSKETNSKEKEEKSPPEKQNSPVSNAPPTTPLDPPPPLGPLAFGDNIHHIPSLSLSPSRSEDKSISEHPIIQMPILPQALPSPSGKLVFGQNGLLIDNNYTTYRDALRQMEMSAVLNQPSLPPKTLEHPHSTSPPPSPAVPAKKSWISSVFEIKGPGMRDPDLVIPEMPVSSCEKSIRFSTLGERSPHQGLGGVNGMYTTLEEAIAHANYTANLASNQKIDWVYNHSNGPIIDGAEILTLNFLGISPNTKKLLQENWSEFHIQNADRPHAKYLQICHSQGALHVRNALMRAPKEIRERVIVLAIAPAVVVPREICFQSFNYASKNDPVQYGELAFAGALDTNEFGTSKIMEMTLEFREQLILLEPHPDATGIDHDYQSPTFRTMIAARLDDYLTHDGEYK